MAGFKGGGVAVLVQNLREFGAPYSLRFRGPFESVGIKLFSKVLTASEQAIDMVKFRIVWWFKPFKKGSS